MPTEEERRKIRSFLLLLRRRRRSSRSCFEFCCLYRALNAKLKKWRERRIHFKEIELCAVRYHCVLSIRMIPKYHFHLCANRKCNANEHDVKIRAQRRKVKANMTKEKKEGKSKNEKIYLICERRKLRYVESSASILHLSFIAASQMQRRMTWRDRTKATKEKWKKKTLRLCDLSSCKRSLHSECAFCETQKTKWIETGRKKIENEDNNCRLSEDEPNRRHRKKVFFSFTILFSCEKGVHILPQKKVVWSETTDSQWTEIQTAPKKEREKNEKTNSRKNCASHKSRVECDAKQNSLCRRSVPAHCSSMSTGTLYGRCSFSYRLENPLSSERKRAKEENERNCMSVFENEIKMTKVANKLWDLVEMIVCFVRASERTNARAFDCT